MNPAPGRAPTVLTGGPAPVPPAVRAVWEAAAQRVRQYRGPAVDPEVLHGFLLDRLSPKGRLSDEDVLPALDALAALDAAGSLRRGRPSHLTRGTITFGFSALFHREDPDEVVSVLLSGPASLRRRFVEAASTMNDLVAFSALIDSGATLVSLALTPRWDDTYVPYALLDTTGHLLAVPAGRMGEDLVTATGTPLGTVRFTGGASPRRQLVSPERRVLVDDLASPRPPGSPGDPAGRARLVARFLVP